MTTNLDRVWFAKNPHANVRLRRPGPGEVEEIVKTGFAGSAYDLALIGGTFPPPSPDVEWWVMVISAGGVLIRFLTMRDKGTPLKVSAQMDVYGIVTGERVPVDIMKE